MMDLFLVGNDSRPSKWNLNSHCCFEVRCMFHFSMSNFTLNLLAKKPIGIPMKLVFCFNRAFVPFLSSSHELSNLRCDVWIWS